MLGWVYWVAFVTGISFTLHLWIVDFIAFLTCWGKSAFEPGLLFLRNKHFSELVIFLLFANPYTRMGVLTIRSFSLCLVKNYFFCETPVESFFCFLSFSISLIISLIDKGKHFGDPTPPFPPLMIMLWSQEGTMARAKYLSYKALFNTLFIKICHFTYWIFNIICWIWNTICHASNIII